MRPTPDRIDDPRLDPRWEAVRARDPAADGRFVFAVRTTGIYCRPSCRSRAPRPHNVRFFAAGADAERAGFRACLRCRPDRPADDVAARIVAQVCRFIDEREAPPPLAELARRASLSPSYLHRLFKAQTGVTPRAYAAARRAERARAALAEGHKVVDALYEAGFGSSGRLYAEPRLGAAPAQLRRGGAGLHVRWTSGASSLGRVLCAATERGVCALLIGDDDAALAADLRARLPRATLERDDVGLQARLAAAVALVEDPGRGAQLPLDVRGTAFQERVWQALRAIPAGTTSTYAAIAQTLAAPAAVRAIAQACARNPVAIAIPCHRVLRSDGGLSGYRWGVARKRALLERERPR